MSTDRIAFASRLLSDGGSHWTSGGDPEDVASYYYTNEETWGAAHAALYVQFQVDRPTPFAVEFSGVGRAAEDVEELSFALSRDLPLSIPSAGALVFDRTSLLGQSRGRTARMGGILEPGWTYRLSIDHQSVERQDMAFAFQLVVPEPGTGLRLGLGLAGVCASHRRRP